MMFVSATTLVATVAIAPPVTVSVQVARTVPRVVLMSALNEANDIWQRSGVQFNWSFDHLEHSPLRVIVHDGSAPASGGEKVGAAMIGRIVYQSPEVRPEIHLHYDLVKALYSETEGTASGTETTLIMRDRALGRALGRILAHELGHYLLGPRAHTDKGLMRPQWRAEDLFSLRRRAFIVEIDEAQKNRIAARLSKLSAWAPLRASQ